MPIIDKRRKQIEYYPFSMQIHPRFADLDFQRHVNNVSIASYYQESRVRFNRNVFQALYAEGEDQSLVRKVLADIGITYLAEVNYPEIVTIGVGVSRIGNSSFTLSAGMFQLDQCVGISDAVLVFTNTKATGAMPQLARDNLAGFRLDE